jgi:hypothetical protein
MKFPTATVILVSSALAYVLWSQSQEPPPPLDADRIANLSSAPVERGRVLDWVIQQLPRLCEEATGAAQGSDDHAECVDASESRSSSCRRSMADNFPGTISSEQQFRDLSVTMMDCLVQQSRFLGD